MDTPGLADQQLREAAADAIKKGLTQNGFYNVFFAMSFQNGRVRPDDVTTMKLVLEAAPIMSYGIITNQVGVKAYESIHTDSHVRGKVVNALWFNFPQEKREANIRFAAKDAELEEGGNVVKPLPDALRAFIQATPAVVIAANEVKDVFDSPGQRLARISAQLSTEGIS